MPSEDPSYPRHLSLRVSDSEDLYSRCLQRLIVWAQQAYQHPLPSFASHLAQELATMTDNNVLFLVAREPLTQAISLKVPAGRSIIPVEWDQLRYGYLAIEISALDPHARLLSLTYQLAQFCGWLLRTIEDAAVLQRTRHRLTPQSLQRVFTLSPRCQQILALMISGAVPHEIAHHLHISKRTVERHQFTCYRHLAVTSAAEAIALGVAADLGPQEAS